LGQLFAEELRPNCIPAFDRPTVWFDGCHRDIDYLCKFMDTAKTVHGKAKLQLQLFT
jgi:hypothetical protein